MKLRDYQQECVDRILRCKQGDKVIAKLATGAGKTIIAAGLVKALTGRVLFVVPSKELREQTIDKFKKFCGDDLDIGSVQGKLDEVTNRIVVATRQSLTHSKSTRMERMLYSGRFDYVIIDEAHNAVFQIKKILEKLNDDIVCIGLTATPYNQDMPTVFTETIYEKSILDMIETKHLVEPRAILVQSETSLDDVHTVAGEFNLGELEDTLNNEDRNNLVVSAYKKHASDRKHCLIFATGIEHSEAIAKAFNSNGVECYSVSSSNDTQERENVIQGFKSGKFKVLVNVGILTTGFDHPELDCVIFARCTKSRILYEQCLGRSLRTAEGKKDALIIDIVDITSKHDLMSMSDVFNIEILDGETPSDALERIKNEEELEKLRKEEEKRSREERIRKQQELIAKEVKLFNTSFDIVFNRAMLDWIWYNNNTYCVMVNQNESYILERVAVDNFVVYKSIKDGYDMKLSIVYTSDNLKDTISYAEDEAITYGTSYCRRNSKWKTDPATDKQKACVKGNFKANTKWDVSKYFHNRSLYFAMKKIKQDMEW